MSLPTSVSEFKKYKTINKITKELLLNNYNRKVFENLLDCFLIITCTLRFDFRLQ